MYLFCSDPAIKSILEKQILCCVRAMTSPNEMIGAAVQEQPEPVPSKIVELLDRLGAGERLADAPLAMGLSQEQAQAIFLRAAEIVRQNLDEPAARKRCPVKGSVPDWKKMTVAQALEILSDRAAKREDAAKGGNEDGLGSSVKLASHDKAGIAADPDAL
jgi:hypothetical protein